VRFVPIFFSIRPDAISLPSEVFRATKRPFPFRPRTNIDRKFSSPLNRFFVTALCAFGRIRSSHIPGAQQTDFVITEKSEYLLVPLIFFQ
jgi:hypothetical protein